MKTLTTVLIILIGLAACSRADTVKTLMEGYLWENRLILVFAPSADHPSYQKQMLSFENNAEALNERDTQIWRFINLESVFIDGQHRGHLSTNPFYDHFEIKPRTFAVILIGKDGEEKARFEDPAAASEFFDMIAAMPMRQREMNKNET